MGSFAFTCTLSGLPIAAGDPVRFLLLTQNPYHRGKTAGASTCYPHDIWFPRTFPLRAEYDDYGGVEKLQAGPQQDAWASCFKRDLVEKGWGDNSAHDVPTRKDMPLDKLLVAIREGRCHVRGDVDRKTPQVVKAMPDSARKERGEPVIPKGNPTRRRVERLLVKLGYKLGDGYRDGMLVNRVDANTVRVRMGDFKDRGKALAKIRDEMADKFAGMVRSGTGRYADDAELILCPLPGVHARHAKDREPALCVSSAMIREDVWQAMCALAPTRGYDGLKDPVEKYRQHAADAWAKSVDFMTAFAGSPEIASSMRSLRHMTTGTPQDVIPFTVGLGSHWWTMVDLAHEGKVSDAERDCFTRAVGEFTYIQHWLSVTRYQWHPSAACGPQFGEWSAHVALLNALHAVASVDAAADAAARDQ